MVNYIDRMADSLVDVLKYSDSSVEWPEAEHFEADSEINPEWFYPALQSGAMSEIMAILLYTQQAGLYDEEIGDLVLGIGLVEMKHFANIRDTVLSLGGTIPQPMNGAGLLLGASVNDALAINVKNEFATIKYYQSVKDKIKSESQTAKLIQAMLDKLIADESLHLKMFYQELDRRGGAHLLDNVSETLFNEYPKLRISQNNIR